MIVGDGIVVPAEALAAAKEFLRVGHDGEDALIGPLVVGAAELCERFTGLVLLARTFDETLPVKSGWQRLGRTPVRSIGAVEGLEGVDAAPLPADAYAIDIDADGDGWIRVTARGGAERLRIGYEAGLARAWADLPETLRHGIVRLAAHLYAERGADAPPPAAVTALWRPWRRLRLGMQSRFFA